MQCVVFGSGEVERSELSAGLRRNLGENSSHVLTLRFVSANVASFDVACLSLLCHDAHAVCISHLDAVRAEHFHAMHLRGVRLVVLRHASVSTALFDLDGLRACNTPHPLQLARTPVLSAHVVAELTLALVLCAAKHIPAAAARVRCGDLRGDFQLGTEIHGKTAGIVGTGKVGVLVASALRALGCRIIAYDVAENDSIKTLAGGQYVPLDDLWGQSDLICLHAPLVSATIHMVDEAAVSKMKRGVVLVNTSRGKLVDSRAVRDGVLSGQIGALAMDVVDCAPGVLGVDHEFTAIPDPELRELISLPNVTITPTLATRTRESLHAVCDSVAQTLTQFALGRPMDTVVNP
mmetsp:Transcript_12643/g.27581  ORF Transcript_12643/g.27581 Transcript_12643/m.27581 type:complete len:349 (+) Transcript_12643:72-1118(+)